MTHFTGGALSLAQLKDQFADDAQLPKRLTAFDAEIAKLEQAQAAERELRNRSKQPGDAATICGGSRKRVVVPLRQGADTGSALLETVVSDKVVLLTQDGATNKFTALSDNFPIRKLRL